MNKRKTKMKIDLVGQKFGCLVILRRGADYISPKGRKQNGWECRCDCGNTKTIKESSLRYCSNPQSCGRYHKKHPKANIYGKTIPVFSNYSVTKDGRIWGKKGKGRWLKPIENRYGYLRVNLFRNGINCPRYIHQLVLETYVGLCPIGMETRHFDGNPANNNLDNLCYGTKSENSKDAVRHGTCPGLKKNRGEKHPKAILTEQDVRMIIYMWRTKLFTQTEIAGIYNVNRRDISHVINKKTWRHIWVA